MNVRRICVGLTIVAVAACVVATLAPVRTTVPVSLAPFQQVLDNLQIRAGGKLGVTVTLADRAVTLDCGPVADPADVEVDTGGSLGQAAVLVFNLEHQLQRGCDQAIDRRTQWSVGLGVAALMFLLVGLLAGSAHHRRRSAEPEFVITAFYLGTHPSASRALGHLCLSIRRGGLIVQSKRKVLATLPWRRVRSLEVLNARQLAAWSGQASPVPRQAWKRRYHSYLALDDDRGRWIFATPVEPSALELEVDGIRSANVSGAWSPPTITARDVARPPATERQTQGDEPIVSAQNRRSRRLPYWGAWLAGAAAIGVVAFLAIRSSDGSATMSVGDGASAMDPNAEDPVRAQERICIESAVRSADADFQTASVRSSKDRDEAVLNRDGDGAYVQLASDLQVIDLTSCPTDFQSSFAQYAQSWLEFGNQWRSSTQRPLRGAMSDTDRQVLLSAINQARSILVAVAANHGATVRTVTLA